MKEDWGEAAWTARDIAPTPSPRWRLWLAEIAAGALLVAILCGTALYVALKDSPYDPPATPVIHKSKPVARPATPPAICREPVPDEPLYDAFPLCP